MQREQLWQLLDTIPEADYTKTVLVLKSGLSVNIDTLFRREIDFLVIRGREAGSNDEGRAFFLPYEEISYVKIERLVRLNELRAMYGEALQAGSLLDDDGSEAAEPAKPTINLAETPKPAPAAAAPQDPASIAKQNLLDRIRAARTGQVGKK